MYSSRETCSRTLRFTWFLILSICPVSVMAQNQQEEKRFSVKANDIPVINVLDSVEKLVEKRFYYWDSCFSRHETLHEDFIDVTLTEFLQKTLDVRGFTWEIKPDRILLHCKVAAEKRLLIPVPVISGVVRDEKGKPLPGATVKVLSTNKGVSADSAGRFKVMLPTKKEYLLVTCIGFEQEVVLAEHNMAIHMKKHIDELDEIIITAYGTTTRRLNTGSIEVVKPSPLNTRAGTDALLGLAGKVPGIAIRQTSGLPGAKLKVNIRGLNSLNSGTEPLYVIDGIPVAPDVENGFGNITEKISSMIFWNESDFEQIEILKDADATAIYGSRGANGVVLITTKKGKAGPLQLEVKLSQGMASVSRRIDLMNNKQYLEMRHEAFANAGMTATSANAPDIFKWDTTSNTDWQQELTGGTMHITDAQVIMSGGTKQFQYLFSNYYHRNTTVYPGQFNTNSGGSHFYLHVAPPSKRFSLSLTGNASFTGTILPGRDPAGDITLPPVYPALTLARGGLNYESEPAVLLKKGPVYEGNALNTAIGIAACYQLRKNLLLSLNAGYNELFMHGNTLSPIAMQPPALRDSTTGSVTALEHTLRSLILEPRLNYANKHWTFILGSTYHIAENITGIADGWGYKHDRYIRDITAAPYRKETFSNETYKYLASFGRLQYNLNGTFLLNLTFRRDGSSRFGPAMRYGNWWAVGAGWVFSEDKRLKKRIPFLQYGKLRASYGLVGNDQIGNGRFNETYEQVEGSYMGKQVLTPLTLANRSYTWEVTRKFDAGLETRFLERNRIAISVNYYNNYSYNQLMKTSLPNTAGLSTVLANMPATLRNSGWELLCKGGLIMTNKVAWNAAFNISFEKNRLLSYPGLKDAGTANSPLGRPVTVVKVYKLKGVDAGTGLPQFSAERTEWKHNLPWCYGGLQSRFSWKQFQFEAQFKFFLQEGLHDVRAGATMPGTMRNQPVEVTDRWRKPGDNAVLPKVSLSPDMQAIYEAKLKQSDYLYTNSSFMRCSVLSLSWQLPPGYMKRMHIKDGYIHFMATNPFIITGYPGMDPEVQSMSTIPPLRGLTVGLQISL